MKLKNRVTAKSGTILDLVELQRQFLGNCVTQGMKRLLFPLLKNMPRIKIQKCCYRRGNENENHARHKYCEYIWKSHVNHSVDLSGVILNPDFPYLGASPDGIVNCLCCGLGCLEIKCSSKYRDNLIEDMIFGSCGIWNLEMVGR